MHQQGGKEAIAVLAIARQTVQENGEPIGSGPSRFREFVQREFEKWRTVVRDSRATVEEPSTRGRPEALDFARYSHPSRLAVIGPCNSRPGADCMQI